MGVWTKLVCLCQKLVPTKNMLTFSHPMLTPVFVYPNFTQENNLIYRHIYTNIHMKKKQVCGAVVLSRVVDKDITIRGFVWMWPDWNHWRIVFESIHHGIILICNAPNMTNNFYTTQQILHLKIFIFYYIFNSFSSHLGHTVGNEVREIKLKAWSHFNRQT